MGKSKAKTKAIKAGGRRQSNKKDKVSANKLFRRRTKIAIKVGNEEKIPSSTKEVSDNWNFCSDGLATYWNDLPEKYMRK